MGSSEFHTVDSFVAEIVESVADGATQAPRFCLINNNLSWEGRSSLCEANEGPFKQLTADPDYLPAPTFIGGATALASDAIQRVEGSN